MAELSGRGFINKSSQGIKNNILYKRPEISGQVVSYYPNDEVSLKQQGRLLYTPPQNPKIIATVDQSAVDSYNVLAEPNVFGSLLRSTDTTGAPAPGNFDIVDHVTGLVQFPSFSFQPWETMLDAVENWNATITDKRFFWRIPTLNEAISIFRYAQGGASGTPVWTCTTVPADTNKAFTIDFNNGQIREQDKSVAAFLIGFRAYADGEGETFENLGLFDNRP